MKKLDRTVIKYIVIIAMLLDHIAWGFVPMQSLLGQGLHFVGRLTGPTMAYFVVEGYLHTSDVKKYTKRLALFALISWLPFTYFEYGHLPIYHDIDGNLSFIFAPGVIYTLLLSLLALRVFDSKVLMETQKQILIFALLFLSIWGDWGIFDIVFVLIFFKYRDNEKMKWIMYSIVAAFTFFLSGFGIWSLFQLGVFMVPLLLGLLYNGKPGSRLAFHKWFFYIFYPAHLLLLGLVRYL